MQQVFSSVDLSQVAYVDDAIRLLRACQPKEEPYYGCFSGGKDSCVIKEISKRAGVDVVWHYNVTTIDPPELVKFVRRQHPDVLFDRPECNFFTYAIRHKKGFPTRRARWCCERFKEAKSPRGSRLILGVRAAESPRRKKAWTPVTHHRRAGVVAIAPILGWSDEMVWDFIESEKLPYCCLYDEGFDRLGCIGCPMARKAARLAELARWPGYERKWRQLFRDTWAMRVGGIQKNGQVWFGEHFFATWEEMYEWWLSGESLPKDECQGLIELFV